jgi:hypothetical protein
MANDSETLLPATKDSLPSDGSDISADPPRKSRSRSDRGKIHVVRHAALSKHPLECLRSLGEDTRALRSMERELWEELKPAGAIGKVLFDHFWTSHLRCLLVARMEAIAFGCQSKAHSTGEALTLRTGEFPVLVSQQGEVGAEFRPDLLQTMLLAARYDRTFGRQMYRMLNALLVLRDGTSFLDSNGSSAVELEPKRQEDP